MANRRVSLPENVLKMKPKDFRFVSYIYCKQTVNLLGLNSLREYKKWRDDYKPGGFPLRPDKVYSEWENWQVFLETDNVYLADKVYAVRDSDIMDYWDAVNVIQPMGFKTIKEYQQAFEDGLIPARIPNRPHQRYSVFYKHGGYKTWLGKHVRHQVQAAANIQTLFVLYRTEGRSSNVLSIMIHKKGISDLMVLVRESKLEVLKVYKWEESQSTYVFNLLDSYGSKQDERTWMFSNTNEVMYELGSILEVYRSVV